MRLFRADAVRAYVVHGLNNLVPDEVKDVLEAERVVRDMLIPPLPNGLQAKGTPHASATDARRFSRRAMRLPPATPPSTFAKPSSTNTSWTAV